MRKTVTNTIKDIKSSWEDCPYEIKSTLDTFGNVRFYTDDGKYKGSGRFNTACKAMYYAEFSLVRWYELENGDFVYRIVK